MHRIASWAFVSSLVACAPGKVDEPSTSPPPAEPPAAVEPAAAPVDEAPAVADPPPATAPAAPEDAAPEVATPEVPAPETPPPGFVPIPAKRKGGFPGVAFTEVRAFAFDLHNGGAPKCGVPLDEDGTLCKTVKRPGVVLSDAQTKSLLGMLTKPSTWGEGSACFLPHHGFVFYDDAGTPVAQISVCFMCQMMVSAPSIPKAKKLGRPDTYGLNEKSNARLRALCRELGLPKCDARSPMEFDGSP